MEWLLTLMVVMALIPAAGFVVIYSRSPWNKNPIGRAVMWMTFSLALVCVSSLLSQIAGDYPGREWVRVTVVLLAVAALWNKWYTLIQVQNRNPKYINWMDNEDKQRQS